MSTDKATCQLCGEPMPVGEEMFNYHGYSGPCPKPPLTKPAAPAALPSSAGEREADAWAITRRDGTFAETWITLDDAREDLKAWQFAEADPTSITLVPLYRSRPASAGPTRQDAERLPVIATMHVGEMLPQAKLVSLDAVLALFPAVPEMTQEKKS